MRDDFLDEDHTSEDLSLLRSHLREFGSIDVYLKTIQFRVAPDRWCAAWRRILDSGLASMFCFKLHRGFAGESIFQVIRWTDVVPRQ